MSDFALKLMVAGSSDFLGRYVLREAAHLRHRTVAMARSEAPAAAVTTLGARSEVGYRNEDRAITIDHALDQTHPPFPFAKGIRAEARTRGLAG